MTRKRKRVKNKKQTEVADVQIVPTRESIEDGYRWMGEAMIKGMSTLVMWKCESCREARLAPALGRYPDCPICGNQMKLVEEHSLKDLGIDCP